MIIEVEWCIAQSLKKLDHEALMVNTMVPYGDKDPVNNGVNDLLS